MSKTFAKLSTPSDLSNEGRKELGVLKGHKVGVNLAVFLRPFYFLRLENYLNRKLIHTQLHYSCNKDCRCGINTILNNFLSEQNYIEVLSLPSEVYCRKKKTFHRVPLQFFLVT